MAGRIREESIELVRERIDFAEVVREHVNLRNAGAGSLKGLCPFHDEKSPSFTIRPHLKHYMCFGCGESGGVFDFVMKLESLTFPEAVERLANRAGVQLQYEQGGVNPRQQSQRTRLIEAHRAATTFYAEQLDTPEASTGRAFLAERGFDAAAARRYSVGYAPATWDALTKHLRGRGFTQEELVAGGLAKEGRNGLRDSFVGRLLWPIGDLNGDVVGFGARKLREDDPGPKYLNTPETPIYRKSALLYGADMAKREIGRRLQIVVVEGYTDVMACHLSGVETAVATCGTAFGDEHVKIVRRLLADQNEFRGEVIFTFDGDEAGRRAALKAFDHDQKFVTQTFVAVSDAGMDPCDLRQKKGPEAVRDLVARRIPLFEFAIKTTIGRYDLDAAEGRIGALREAAPVVAGIRDVALRPEYVRGLAGWLGLEIERVAEAVRAAGGTDRPEPRRPHDPADPAHLVEREILRLALRAPDCLAADFDEVSEELFVAAPARSVYAALKAAGGVASGSEDEQWLRGVREAAPDDGVRRLVTELALEPMAGPIEARYGSSLLARLRELAVTRRVTEVKSRLQRVNPIERAEEYNRLFGELVALEQQRRELRELSLGWSS